MALPYYPLESTRSFRLVSLSSSTEQDGAIECSITCHELTSGQFPEYAALSYMWGSPDRSVPILLDGIQVNITPSLLEAMEHLTEIQQNRTDIRSFWWIDMLCINQDDDRERGHQVGMMRDIFQSASLIVAWLGPEADGSGDLMRALASTSKDFRRISGSGLLQQEREFLSRPYWSRIWIIQELCVAREILLTCGKETAPWMSLQTGCAQESITGIFSNAIGKLSVTDFRLLIPYNLVDLRTKFKQQRMSLGSLLTFSSQSACTDPRDRVFSLLGLTNDGSAEEIILNYSFSPCSVYCSAIRAIIKTLSRRVKQGTEEEARIRAIIRRCRHEPLEKNYYARSECDGIGCDAWWCCLDIALLDS